MVKGVGLSALIREEIMLENVFLTRALLMLLGRVCLYKVCSKSIETEGVFMKTNEQWIKTFFFKIVPVLSTGLRIDGLYLL